MLSFNWISLKKPRSEERVYYWKYTSPIVSTTISESEKRQATEKGLNELLSYYGKEFINKQSLINDSLDRFEIYLDPRPICTTVDILVSITEEQLSSLPDKKYDVDNLIVVNTTLSDLTEGLLQLFIGIQRHIVYSNLWNKYLHIDGFIIDLIEKSILVNKFVESLSFRGQLNDVVIQPEDPVQLLFNTDRRFVGAIAAGTPLIKGASLENGITNALTDQFVGQFVSRLDTVVARIKNLNTSRSKENWQEFYKENISYGNVTFEAPTQEKNFLDRSTEELLNRTNLPSFLESRGDRVERELERFKDIPNQFLGQPCGPLRPEELSRDIDRISKTRSQKDAEDILLNNSTFRAQVHERNRNRLDYVGDIIFDQTPKLFPFGPSSIGEVYDNVLNYISIDTLIKKSMQCLLVQGELPELWKLCIDVYVPFSLSLPDNLKIPDIFGFISNLIVKALLFALQQALFLIIDAILDALDKCIRGKIIETGISDNLDAITDADLASQFMAQKVYDNIDSLGSAANLVEDEFVNTKTLLEDVAAALTPSEFCMLIAGTASQDVYKIVLCIIETRYPAIAARINTVEKVKALFSSLGNLIDSDLCDIDIPVPTSNDLCITKEHINIRENLIANKFQGISPTLLQEQLSAAEDRRKQTIDMLGKFLGNQNALTDEIVGDNTKEFLVNLSPCAEDNDPMKHMIELSTDSIVDPLSSFFVQASLGDAGLSSQLTSKYRQDFLQDIRRPGFVSSTDNKIKISSGPQQVSYETANSQLTQIFTSNITYESVSTRPPEISESSQTARLDALKYVSPNLDESDYARLFQLLTEFITLKISESKVYQATEEDLLAALDNLISPATGNPALFENCWIAGENIRKGMTNDFFAEDCKTRDTTLYNQVILAGLIRLYVRTIMIEFFFANLGVITQFNSTDLINTFIKDFATKKIDRFRGAIEKTIFLDDLDAVVESELGVVFDEFSNLFEDFTNPQILEKDNILNYFFDYVDILDEDPKYEVSRRFYFLPSSDVDQTKNEVRVSLDLKYIKRTGANPEFETLLSSSRKIKDISSLLDFNTDTVVQELKNEMRDSDDAKLLFGFSIPVNDILSFLGIYNATRIRNNVFIQLFNMIANAIDSVEHADNFEYRNRNFERQNKLQQANSHKKGNKKKKIEEILDN